MLRITAGRPLVDWVLERVSLAVLPERITLTTSADATDDPLAAHVAGLGFQVFRGDLNNVAVRFRDCLDDYPADWIVRICGDSPMLDPGIITCLSRHCSPDLDLVTNVQKRTFPPGQSVEFINARTFEKLNFGDLHHEEKEHLTQVFYRNPERYQICNVEGNDHHWREQSYVVDTKDDLQRLEPLMQAGKFPRYFGVVRGGFA